MSVEASGWAFRQAIPARPKIVLMALADQADERSGHVCYGKTDMSHIARKASVPVRSLYRYIAALERNGYLRRESGKGRGQSSAFWLCFDRLPSALEDWLWTSSLPDGGYATVAYFTEGGMPPNGRGGMPPNGRGGMPYVADIRPLNIQEHQKEPVDNFGGREGQPSDGALTKPPNGSQGRGMIWWDHGTPEWQLYADDYFEHRGVKKNPEQRIGGSGNWFVRLGEPENGNHRIQNQTPRA